MSSIDIFGKLSFSTGTRQASMTCLGKFETVVSPSGGGGGGKWAEIINVCSSFGTGR